MVSKVKKITTYNEKYYFKRLKGEDGDTGLSAYEVAVKNGFVGNEVEWLNSIGNAIEETFETIDKNLKSYSYTFTYGLYGINTKTYDLGNGLRIIKTFNYTLGILTSMVLSGDIPLGRNLTKTFNYTDDILTSVSYT